MHGSKSRGGRKKEQRGVCSHIRRTILTNIMIAKRIRTPLLPMMARPVNVSPALTLAAHPSPVEILQPARPRAAGRRDEASSPRARVLACGLGRRKDGGGRTRRVLVGGRVDGGGRAIRVSGDEAGRVHAGVLVVVVDERVLAHACDFFFCLGSGFIFGRLVSYKYLRFSERRGAETS